MPLNYLFKNFKRGYKFTKSQENINHFVYTDDIKIFAKKENVQKILLQIIRINSHDIGIKFWIEESFRLIIKKKGKKRNNGRERTV